MIYCLELDKSFDSLKDMHSALKINEHKIISLKKAQIYKSADKGQLSVLGSYLKAEGADKASLGLKSNYIYPVINTTKYLDSHNDVHFDGIWKKSLKEQQGNIFYIDNHSFKVEDVIAWNEDVRAYTKNINWSLVGKDYEGKTQALIFEIDRNKLKKQSAIDVVNDKRNVQNSVSMQYVKIQLAVNTNDKDFKENKEYFDKRYPEIANKEAVDELGYFWGVEEAKIVKEGSMVLAGSNDATSILNVKTEEPEESTLKDNEPLDSTQLVNKILNIKF